MMNQQISIKELLVQAYRVEQRVNTKWEQINSLRDLAEVTSQNFCDMPGSPNRNISKMENYISKMVDLQTELFEDIDILLETKKCCMALIKKVDDIDGQIVLEKRYLCYKRWEEIAVELGYTVRQIYRIHDKALECLVGDLPMEG